jgi:hypothetical protein
MIKGFKKTNKQTRYWREADHLRFNVALAIDKPIVNLCNFVAKEIKVCPQTTCREATMRGLMEIAREGNIDLTGVILTADSDEAKEHSDTSYQGESKSQEKKAV